MGIKDRMQSFSFCFEKEDGTSETITNEETGNGDSAQHSDSTNDMRSNSRYIKLGGGNSGIEAECIAKNIAYIGFGTDNDELYELAANRRWDDFYSHKLSTDSSGSASARKQRATSATNQVKAFFEADEDLIWITFHGGYLYHGRFSRQSIPAQNFNMGGCTRQLQGSWLNTDANKIALKIENLSGLLTKIRGFQGTSCALSDDQHAYLNRRLSGKVPEFITVIDKARREMESGVLAAIQSLQPSDFELLVEIVFSRTWRRVGKAGGNEAFTDIIYENPLKPGQNFAVQVKSEGRTRELLDYCSHAQAKRYEHFYFVFHTPAIDSISNDLELPKNLEVVDGCTLAGLVIDSGLVYWLKEKTS